MDQFNGIADRFERLVDESGVLRYLVMAWRCDLGKKEDASVEQKMARLDYIYSHTSPPMEVSDLTKLGVFGSALWTISGTLCDSPSETPQKVISSSGCTAILDGDDVFLTSTIFGPDLDGGRKTLARLNDVARDANHLLASPPCHGNWVTVQCNFQDHDHGHAHCWVAGMVLTAAQMTIPGVGIKQYTPTLDPPELASGDEPRALSISYRGTDDWRKWGGTLDQDVDQQIRRLLTDSRVYVLNVNLSWTSGITARWLAEAKKSKSTVQDTTTKIESAKIRMIDLRDKGKLPESLRKTATLLKSEGFLFNTIREAAHRSKALTRHFNLKDNSDPRHENNDQLLDELAPALARQFEMLPQETRDAIDHEWKRGDKKMAIELVKTLAVNPDAGRCGDVPLIENTDQNARKGD